MKTIFCSILIVALIIPMAALAEEPIIQKVAGSKAKTSTVKSSAEAVEATSAEMAEEPIVEKDVSAVEEKAPAKTKEKVEKPAADKVVQKKEQNEVVDELPPADDGGNVKAVDVRIEKTIHVAPSFNLDSRKGRFQAGLVGPGIYAGNKSIDAMMGIGVEGEYFFFEKLSAGLRIMFATDFKKDASPNAVVSFVPQARYVFDFDRHPRFSIYVQAGAGVALVDGSTAYADIAIPGGGFWWRWNENFSIGLDAALHILARSEVAVAGFIGPALRYLF